MTKREMHRIVNYHRLSCFVSCRPDVRFINILSTDYRGIRGGGGLFFFLTGSWMTSSSFKGDGGERKVTFCGC